MKDCCDNCKEGKTCCDDEHDHAPSAKLYRRRGEGAATRYYPLRQSDGALIVVAAQGLENEREVFQLGTPLAAKGDGVFFDSYQAAKASMYRRLKQDGDPKPGRAFGAFTVHADPTGATMQRRVRASSAVKGSKKLPGGGSLVRYEGELEGDRNVEKILASIYRQYGTFPASEPGARILVAGAIKDEALKAARRRYRDDKSIREFVDGYRSKAEARVFRSESSKRGSLMRSSGRSESDEMDVYPSGSPMRVAGIAAVSVGAVALTAATVSHFYLRSRVAEVANNAREAAERLIAARRT